MRKIFIIVLFSIGFPFHILGQDTHDNYKTKNGNITIQPKLHSSLVITYNDLSIAVDPYGGSDLFKENWAPNLILITDIHGDHLNQSTLDLLDISNTTFIVPLAVQEKLPPEMASRSVVLKNGQGVHRNGVFVMAVPMYNLPETPESRHPKGRGNGYIIEIEDKRIYISGDTSGIDEMKILRDIDIAFVCMNLPYTMDIQEASESVLSFNPKIVYPYHYRGKDGLSDIKKFKELVNSKNDNIYVRLKNWYPNN